MVVPEFESEVGWFVGTSRFGPLRMPTASSRMECRRRSCEDMNVAECRSPVQRVMSMQSRDWLRRVRREERLGRARGWSEDSESDIGG